MISYLSEMLDQLLLAFTKICMECISVVSDCNLCIGEGLSKPGAHKSLPPETENLNGNSQHNRPNSEESL